MIVQPPKRLDLALRPTPLQPLDRLSAEVGGPRIWVKRDDLTGSVLSGNKVRKLEFTLAQSQAEGCDTIITCGGLQSNHCRAAALLCAQLGLHCHLVLRGEPAGDDDGNLLLDRLAGASIETMPAPRYQATLTERLQACRDEFAARGRRAFIVPTGASDAIGVWGYVMVCEELKADFQRAGIAPGHIVHATGSGGTQAGLTAGAHLFDLGATVWGINVCDDEQWFLDKVSTDLRDWRSRYNVGVDVDSLSINVIDGYVGPGYAKATAEVYETIARVARIEGIVLDPVYTGKAFHGMLDQIARGRFSDSGDIVFVHTGGVFGLFPHRPGFRFLQG